MNKIIIFILLFVSFDACAQTSKDKGLLSINQTSAEAFVGFLASDALEGRQAGKSGGYAAAEYIKSVLQDIGLKPLSGDSYFQNFEAYGKERRKSIRYSVHPDSIAKYKEEKSSQKLEMKNILVCIEGKNKEEYVVVGAHYDHLGINEAFIEDKIYNGADDNASGVSAVLQIAKAFIISGEQPERTVIFALWDGEELGLLGSEYFMQECSFTRGIKGYINFDMIGRNNNESKPKHVVYFYTESHPSFGNWLKEDIRTYNIDLEPDYRAWDKPIGGSDNASFAKRNIPVIWYHTDGHPDYHKPSDHIDKIKAII